MIMNSYMKNRIYYNENKNKNENEKLIYTINETQEIDDYTIINNDNNNNNNDDNNDNNDDNGDNGDNGDNDYNDNDDNDDNDGDKIYSSWSFCKRLHFYFYYPSIFFKNLVNSVKTFTCKI